MTKEQIHSIRQQVERIDMVAVYRAYDSDGRLIYVGIARNWGARFAHHAQHSGWFDAVARLDIEWFPSLATARAMEKDLILRHDPLFNTTHRRWGVSRRKGVARDLRCDRCGCYYGEFAIWTLGARCNDMSVDFLNPCSGRLVLEQDYRDPPDAPERPLEPLGSTISLGDVHSYPLLPGSC